MTKKKVWVFVNAYGGVIQEVKVFDNDVKVSEYFLKERGLDYSLYRDYINEELSATEMKTIDQELKEKGFSAIDPVREEAKIWGRTIE